MGKLIKLATLRKQVMRLEEQNKKLEKIKDMKENAEKERKFLNSRLKSLRGERKPIGKLKKHLRGLAIRSRPLANRIKKALDEAARNN